MSSIKYGGVEIIGSGFFVPDAKVSNRKLAENLGVNFEWIDERSGIKERAILNSDLNTSDMAVSAAKAAIKSANITEQEIDMIIIATFSGDYVFPPLSAKVHKELCLPKEAQILDVQLNCAGFATAMSLAYQRLVLDKDLRTVLVIGAELLSRFTDKHDLETAMFLGDGAGACIMRSTNNLDCGLIAEAYLTDSSNYEAVKYKWPDQPTNKSQPPKNFIEMNGLATWKQVITNLPKAIKTALAKANLEADQIDFFIFHQANVRLIEYLMAKLKVNLEKTHINADRYGNTGSASMAIALAEAFQYGKIKKNQNILIAGVGAGYNFSVIIVRT
ncbi:MAG: 3-oxoacyl-ACP synthase III family protein [Bacteroidetes bacterium]|nr:3-oxoacyl-ACP synthase III family protein [Bacteroidota bacterium]MDA0851607.1 3-oxoacyl-ACP synthase III family protein [Pseudomonadota bacterium]